MFNLHKFCNNLTSSIFLCVLIMKIHNDAVHEGEKPLKFNICDSCFSLKKYLKKHITSVHEEKKPLKQFLILFTYDGNNRLKIPPIHMKFVSSSY